MQFGRVHGLLIVILGVLLVAVQLWSFAASHSWTNSAPTSQSPANGNPADPSTDKGFPVVQFIPGVLGVLCLLVGTTLYVKDLHRSTDVPVHPIR